MGNTSLPSSSQKATVVSCHISACVYVSFMEVYGGRVGADGASVSAHILFVQNLQLSQGSKEAAHWL